MKRTVIAAALLALLGAPLLAAPASADPGRDGAPGRRAAGRDGRFARGHRGGRRMRHARMQRARGMRLIHVLNLTDDQKAAVKSAREATQKVREDTRAAIRGVLADAWKAGDRSPDARKAVREKIKGVLESARNSVEPQARQLVNGLSADQRAKLEEIAKKHGKTFDEAKFLKGVERLLLVPGRHGRHDRAPR